MIGTCDWCEDENVKLFAPLDQGAEIYCSGCQEMAESAFMDDVQGQVEY
jgi:hypothetical protein